MKTAKDMIMNKNTIFSYRIQGIWSAIAAIVLSAGLSSCSDWTRPEALDLAPASQETPEEALALIRAFKQTPHKVMILGMDAVSDNPVARWQHPSSMPDSADYIYIRNLKGGLDAVLASEIGAVQSGKGTKVLADVDYVAIENAWDELQKMKEEAGEATGTQEEFLAFISEQTRLQLECMNAYGCDGVMISYTGSASSTVGDPVQGRSAYINAVYDWWNSNGAGKIIMARGYLLNIASVDVAEEFFGQCRYLIHLVGTKTSASSVASDIFTNTIMGVPSDKYVFEATVPTPSDATQIGMSVPDAAKWISASSETEDFEKLGLCVENAQDDYFKIGRNYADIRRAITILNSGTEAAQ